MKRAFFALAIPAVCVMTLTRCESVLDTQPMGELNTQTFYKTANDFAAATLGVYSTLLNYTWSGGNGLGWYSGVLQPDDDVRSSGNHNNNDFNWTSNNADFSALWRESYKGITRANLVLQQLGQPNSLTDQEKARFAGEAKFMRGYFYFLLARHFGNVPIVTAVPTSVEETRPGNSQPGQVWDLIEKDLEDAAAALPLRYAASDRGRATKGAALALLGKVELYRAQWTNTPAKYTEAIAHLEAVVNSGVYSLVPYGDNFRHAMENNAESVFEVQMSRGDNINGWAPTDANYASAGTGRQINWGASCGPQGRCAPGGWDWGYGRTQLTPTLQEAFEEGDPRKYFTMYSPGETYGTANARPYERAWSHTGATPSKYLRPFHTRPSESQMNQSVSYNNERLIRYADVLLMLAEAHALAPNPNPGRAAQLVNMVRERARNSYASAYGSGSPDAALYASKTRPANLLPNVPAGAGRDWVRRYLIPERRVELALEGHRFDDLVRWIRAGIISKQDIDFGDSQANRNFDPSKHLLKPIPQGELDMNSNLKQNPGY